jgi:EmrB/QacA subfamily drug resistance transporter
MTNHPTKRWLALAVLCAAAFMVILDAQIVILALPSIERALGLSAGDVQWVLSAYLLSFGGLLLLGGRLADLLGRRRVFLAATALFLVSSLACGLAPSGATLVAARAVQGMAAAAMAPAALAILVATFEAGVERNRALGAWSAMGGLGATAALLIGGTLTQALGWEWVFFLNVPVAGALLGLGPLFLDEGRDARRPRAYDPAGAVAITVALVLLIDAIVEAPRAGWTSPRTIGLLAGTALLVAIFAGVESRSAAPLLPLGLLRSRALVGGNLATLLLGMAAWGTGLTLADYAQQVLGYSPLQFGAGTIAMTATTIAGSYAAQRLASRLGARLVAAAGLALVGAGAALLARAPVHGTYAADILPGLLIFGPGLGGGCVAASVAALADVAEGEAGVGSAANTAAFQLGGALGAAVVTTVAAFRAVGPDRLAALAAGYRAGFASCVVFAVIGLALTLVLLPRPRTARTAGAMSFPAGPDQGGRQAHGDASRTAIPEEMNR